MDEFKVSYFLWFHCLAPNWKFFQHCYVAKSIALFFGPALIRMDLGNNGNFKSALLRSNGSSFQYNERKKRRRMYFLSQRHPHCPRVAWVVWGGRNPLGDAFPHKHNFFFSFEVLNYSEGGVTKVWKQNPAQHLICLQVQLVSLNLERNMISSVTTATLAGLSSLYSLSLAGPSHLSAVLNTNTWSYFSCSLSYV